VALTPSRLVRLSTISNGVAVPFGAGVPLRRVSNGVASFERLVVIHRRQEQAVAVSGVGRQLVENGQENTDAASQNGFFEVDHDVADGVVAMASVHQIGIRDGLTVPPDACQPLMFGQERVELCGVFQSGRSYLGQVVEDQRPGPML